MRTVIGFCMVGAVLAQLSSAQAATEVARFPANNTFLNANSNYPDGTSVGVGVTRVLGQPGGPRYELFYIVSNFEQGLFQFGSGLIDAQDFQVTPDGGSLFVDLNTVTLDQQVGDIPGDGIIDVEWEGTGSQRQAGAVFFESENVRGIVTGTTLTNPADITGSAFGTPLFEPFGEIRMLTTEVIVITRE